MRSKKNKKALIIKITIVLILFGLIISFFIANYLSISMKTEFKYFLKNSEIYSLNNIFSNFFVDEMSNKLFIAISAIVISLLLYVVFLSSKKTKYAYDVKLIKLTDTIEIPSPAGKFQHGSAWFIEEQDFDNKFKYVCINKNIDLIKKLIDHKEYKLNDLSSKLFDSGGLVLGKKDIKNTEKIYYVNEDTHSLIIGATRSGKTRSIVLQSIGVTALAGENLVISDPKGELYLYTCEFLEQLNYEVVTIDFSNTNLSNKYNFLQPVIDYVNADDINKAIEVTSDITNSLVGKQTGEPIWHNGECSVISFAILAVVIENKNKPQYQNLTNVYFFISEMCKVNDEGQMHLNAYFEDLKRDTKFGINHPALVEAKISEIAPSKTRGSFFTSALTTLRLFSNSNIYSMTCETDFKINDTSKKRAIFIILPDEKTTYYKIASLFVSSYYVMCVQNAKSRGNRLPIRTNFMLDEFGNFSVIPDFCAKITVGGGYGLRFNLFIQSFKQLDAVYEENDSVTIQDNCDTLVYLKANLSETRQAISDRLGKYTVAATSDSTSINGGSSDAQSGGGNYSSSTSLMERPLLTADEVGRIERPYVLVIRSNEKAILKSPDMSNYIFNELYGLGTKEHNINIIMERQNLREEKELKKMQIWTIWEKYKNQNEKENLKKDSNKTDQSDELMKKLYNANVNKVIEDKQKEEKE